MKFKFLKKATAFVTAMAMAVGTMAVLPDGVLPQFGIVASAEDTQAILFSTGDGSKENPFRIETAAQLSAVRNNLSANYIQVADIDLSGFANWEPVGKKEDPFTGTFNGNGHTISNLQINDVTTGHIGLFGYVQNGNISNVSVTSTNISINEPSRQLNVGVICGVMNNSIISDCTVSGIINIISTNYRTVASGIVGTITSSELASVKRCKNYSSINVEVGATPTCFAAGICGYLNPSNKSNVIISNCSNYGNISSYSPENMCYAAGICGYTSSYGGSIINIEKCSNHGDLTTLTGKQGYSAGITAYCDAFQDNSCTYVSNCYNSGEVVGRTVGGIGGRTYIGAVSGYSAGRKVLFANCYNVGSVSASEGLSVTTFVGSMIGSNYKCSVENCYYLDSSGTSADGKALSSSQLQTASELAGFDFNNVWEYSTTGYLYPVFKSDPSESDDESTIVSGRCGNNAYWSLSTDGVLTISGKGVLYNYSSYVNFGGEDFTTAPWWSLKERIKKIVVKGGITRITEYAFMNMHYVEEILFEDGVKTIDSYNFCCNNGLTKITIPKSVTGIGKLCCWKGGTNSELTIYGYSGSVAETYAKNNNLKFVDLTVVEQPLTTEQKEQMKEFIDQHYFSACSYYPDYQMWNRFHEVSDTMAFYDDNINTEAAHGAVILIDNSVNVINIEIGDTIKNISANAYNSILLDMYYDLEINDNSLVQSIYDDSLRKSVNKAVDPMLEFIKKTSTAGEKMIDFNEIRFEDDVKKWLEGEYSGYSLLDLMENNGLTLSSNAERNALIEELKSIGMTAEELGEIKDVANGIITLNEYMDNMKNIICASALKEMNESYRQVLIEIRDKARTIQGHSWERDDLVAALNYEIDYREYYGMNVTWEVGKSILSAVDSMDGFDGLKKALWETPAENYIKTVFKNGASIISNISAVQIGTKIGWLISDSIFNLTDSTDLYYKGKAYGVLEEILNDILYETAPQLELYEETDTYDEIYAKYKIAEKFDYAFRMYTFVEANGCKTYSEYEKSYLPDEDNWLKAFAHHVGNVVEAVVRIHFGDFSAFQDISKTEQLRNYNALYYLRRCDFIKTNIKCHGDEFNSIRQPIPQHPKTEPRHF